MSTYQRWNRDLLERSAPEALPRFPTERETLSGWRLTNSDQVPPRRKFRPVVVTPRTPGPNRAQWVLGLLLCLTLGVLIALVLVCIYRDAAWLFHRER